MPIYNLKEMKVMVRKGVIMEDWSYDDSVTVNELQKDDLKP